MINFYNFLQESETTLQYHNSLNEKLWDGDKLKSVVRTHLLKIAKTWAEFAKIPYDSIIDIVMTGGNANFNYTKYSDIDVHLIVDKEKIVDCDEDLLDDYLKDKKTLWSLTHDVTIFGYGVELYAQDINEPTSMDQGVYSLKSNKWLAEPVKKQVNLNSPELQRKIKAMKNMIEFFIKNRSDDVDSMKKLKEKIKNIRSSSVRQGGEFSLENLAFKELRNLGYIDRFSDYIISVQDKDLSLEKGDRNDN